MPVVTVMDEKVIVIVQGDSLGFRKKTSTQQPNSMPNVFLPASGVNGEIGENGIEPYNNMLRIYCTFDVEDGCLPNGHICMPPE